MKILYISSKSFVRNFQRSVKRVNERVNDYLDDPNEDNIHDVRTSIRRITTSYRLLPKKIRKKSYVRKYINQCKKLFKVNTEIRDCDIIHGKLAKYSSDPIYNRLASSLKRQRESELSSAHNIALALKTSRLPQLSMNEISELKLQIRLNKVVRNLQDSVAKTLPTVLTNIKKVDELHQLRKDYKKLRYSFELVSRRSKNISRQIDYLKEIQDILGAIHDDDIVIEYLQNVRHSDGVSNILNDQIADRNMQYEEFVRFIEETTHAASKETMFLKN